MFIRLSVRGEVDGVLSWNNEDDEQHGVPVRLWEAMGSRDVGEPLFAGSEVPRGTILDVAQYRADGTILRTWWRLPD